MNTLVPNPELRNRLRNPLRVAAVAGFLAVNMLVNVACSSTANCELPKEQGSYPTSQAPVFSDPGMDLDPSLAELGKLFRARFNKAAEDDKGTNTRNGRYGFYVDISLFDERANTDLETNKRPHIRLLYQAMAKGMDPNFVGFETHDDPGNLDTQSQAASISELDTDYWKASISSNQLFEALDNPDGKRTEHAFAEIVDLIKEASKVPAGGNPPAQRADDFLCA